MIYRNDGTYLVELRHTKFRQFECRELMLLRTRHEMKVMPKTCTICIWCWDMSTKSITFNLKLAQFANGVFHWLLQQNLKGRLGQPANLMYFNHPCNKNDMFHHLTCIDQLIDQPFFFIYSFSLFTIYATNFKLLI